MPAGTNTELFTSTIPNLIGGVSQQSTELRPENMVEDMINCVPSLTQGVIRRNPTEAAVQLLDGAGDPIDTSTAYIHMYDRGNFVEKYIIVIPGDGNWYVYQAHTTSGIPISYATEEQTYLINNTVLPARDVFKCITIADHTFVVNNTINTLMLPEVSAGDVEFNKWAFYWITKTTAYPKGGTSDDLEGYKYTLNGETVQGNSTGTDTLLDAYGLAKELADKTPYANDDDSPFVYTKNLDVTDEWDWYDSFGNTVSLGVWKDIDSLVELPSKLPKELDGFICRVIGSNTAQEDDFYFQYDSETQTWDEIVAPGSIFKIDPTTMPHVFYRLFNGGITFEYNTYQGVTEDGIGLDGVSKWANKRAGDIVSSPLPSFIDERITDMFFHKSRLGFITGNKVVLSEINEFGNFFPKSVQLVIDDDPIDLSVATTDVTVLRAAINSPNGLLLFADYDQFILSSTVKGPLTPSTATIRTVSHYPFNNRIEPLHIGNRIYFTSNESGNTTLYAYQLSDGSGQSTEAFNMTPHVPSYIPATIDNIVGHNVLGYLFMVDRQSSENNIYITSNLQVGGKTIQNAAHRWGIPNVKITHVSVLNNYLYLIDDVGGLYRISLQEPTNIDRVIYKDETLGTDGLYHSRIVFSEFYYRDQTKMAVYTGRTQLRTIEYALDERSHYQTRIYQKDRYDITPSDVLGPIWRDTDVWDDEDLWLDALPYYYRIYRDDKKISVLGNTENTRIIFEENDRFKDKGFAVTTYNIEYLLKQRAGYRR